VVVFTKHLTNILKEEIWQVKVHFIFGQGLELTLEQIISTRVGSSLAQRVFITLSIRHSSTNTDQKDFIRSLANTGP
jgi:hypothetical protein